jgi:hypothetical protein
MLDARDNEARSDPAYDLNPVPRVFRTRHQGGTSSRDAGREGRRPRANGRCEAKADTAQIDRMASAFKHVDWQMAAGGKAGRKQAEKHKLGF